MFERSTVLPNIFAARGMCLRIRYAGKTSFVREKQIEKSAKPFLKGKVSIILHFSGISLFSIAIFKCSSFISKP